MIYTIDELRAIILPIAQKHKISAVYLFGSYARGEATEESDVDILIDREGSDLQSAFDMGGFYNELCECIEKEIDLVTVQMLEQKSTQERKPDFVNDVRKEMVKLL